MWENLTIRVEQIGGCWRTLVPAEFHSNLGSHSSSKSISSSLAVTAIISGGGDSLCWLFFDLSSSWWCWNETDSNRDSIWSSCEERLLKAAEVVVIVVEITMGALVVSLMYRMEMMTRV